MGNYVGSTFATQVALIHPERVSALTLVDPEERPAAFVDAVMNFLGNQ